MPPIQRETASSTPPGIPYSAPPLAQPPRAAKAIFPANHPADSPNHAVPASHLSPTPPLPDPKSDDRIPPSGHPPQGTPPEPPAHYAPTQRRRRARAAKRPPSAPTTTRPEQPPAVGAVKPTPGKPSPSFHPPPRASPVPTPPAEGRSPAPDYFLAARPTPRTPGCGIFGEALEAAVPVPCSCLGLHHAGGAPRRADYARRPRQASCYGREVVAVAAAGCPMSHQGCGLPIGGRGTRGRGGSVTCSRSEGLGRGGCGGCGGSSTGNGQGAEDEVGAIPPPTRALQRAGAAETVLYDKIRLEQETDAVVNGICRAAPEAFETHQKGKVEGPSGLSGLSQPSIAANRSKPLAHALGSVWGEGQLDEIEMCTSRRGASRFPCTVVQHESATPLTSNVGEAC
ncbi:hypothetical protein V502_01284 [Pseudogymnoascus sp. VKM F-4520 (FW-2644)]|nr:hypothetical protein V502_01284 [Pseudogymnoascus sp. VKM F-4520 (FW-2644)]